MGKQVKKMTEGERIAIAEHCCSLTEIREADTRRETGSPVAINAKILARQIDAAIRRALAKQAKEAVSDAMTLAYHAAAGRPVKKPKSAMGWYAHNYERLRSGKPVKAKGGRK